MLINQTQTIIHNGQGYEFTKRSKFVWQFALIRINRKGFATVHWTKTDRASLEKLKADTERAYAAMSPREIEGMEGGDIVAQFIVKAFPSVPVKRRR